MEGSIGSLPPLSPITSRASPPRAPDVDVSISSQAHESFTLQLPTTTTIGTLRSLINLRTNIAQETIHIQHGPDAEKVTLLTKTLADFLPSSTDVTSDDDEVTDEESSVPTVQLSFSFKVEAPARTKVKKQRCSMAGCNDRIAPIVGDCTFCPGKFCSKHRTLQMHLCTGRDESKALAWQRNADALTKSRTVSTKGL